MFVPNSHCLIISALRLLVAVAGILLMGCAGTPIKKLEVLSVDRVTVFCADADYIKQQFANFDGNPIYYDSVYAFAESRFRHIYIPCVEIDGLLLPADQNALGHEVWHLFNFAHPKRAMNPDDWRAR